MLISSLRHPKSGDAMIQNIAYQSVIKYIFLSNNVRMLYIITSPDYLSEDIRIFLMASDKPLTIPHPLLLDQNGIQKQVLMPGYCIPQTYHEVCLSW